MKFNEKLQKLRKENAMSQEELAAQLGVSRQAVSKWENGQGFPETEKLLLLSNLFSVSVDYLLKEEPLQSEGESGTDNSYYASREMVTSFLAARRQTARQIALGVAVIILSFIFPTVTDGLAERVEMLGAVLMLLCMFAGAIILLLAAFRPRRYAAELVEKPLLFDAAFLREFRSGYQAVRRSAGILITSGIGAILLGILSLMLLDTFSRVTSPALLFPFIALGVSLISLGASTLEAHSIIAENEKYQAEQQRSKSSGWIMGAMMTLATAIFLFLGLSQNLWRQGVLAFPVMALLAVAISTVVNRNK